MGALCGGAAFWGLGAVATDRFGATSSRPRMSLMGRLLPVAPGNGSRSQLASTDREGIPVEQVVPKRAHSGAGRSIWFAVPAAIGTGTGLWQPGG